MKTHSRRYGAIARFFRRGAVCHLCGAPVSAEHYGHASDHGAATVTLDHVTPQSHGGTDDAVMPAHLRCNSFRGAAPVAVARVLLRLGRPCRVAPELRARILAARDLDMERLMETLGASERDVAEVIYVATQSAGWAAAEREQAIAQLERGVAPRDVATQYRRGTKAVYKLAQAIKLPAHKSGTRTDPYTREEINIAVGMRAVGKTQREIAAELGRSYKSIGKLFTRLRAGAVIT